MSTLQYRLTLDVPYSFAVQPGFIRSINSPDFHPAVGGINNCFRDHLTGLVMLLPSHLQDQYQTNLQPLGGMRVQSAYWRDVKRTSDAAPMMTHTPVTAGNENLLQIAVDLAIIIINLAALDKLVWAAEAPWLVAPDESICVHYNAVTDQMMRRNNWFAVSWDDCHFHFSHQGVVRVFQYVDRNNRLTGGYKQIDEFQICSPGELLGKDGYFWFIPIPHYGVGVYHSVSPQAGGQFSRSGVEIPLRGHLVPWPTRTVGGSDRLFDTSLLRIAINPFHPDVFGLERVRYPSSGTYIEQAFDPGFTPTVGPDFVQVGVIPTGYGSASGTLIKADSTAAWVAGTDRQARMKLTLNSPDGIHTPFVSDQTVQWSPQFVTRATTPIVVPMASTTSSPDRVKRIEYSTDEQARFEGTADLLLSSAAGRLIADRGDSTFLLERSTNSGGSWTVVNGGFAKEWKNRVVGGMGGFYYECSLSLKGMEERFKECHKGFQSAFDSLSVADSLNNFLVGCGFSPMASVPAAARSAKVPPIPPSGGVYRFAPRVGDRGDEVIHKILMFIHSQGTEYHLRYDWPGQTWVLETKPHDKTSGARWKISTLVADRNVGARVWYQGPGADYNPEPPEANLVLIVGVTSPGVDAAGVYAQPLQNKDSISNTSSPDYLGRVETVKYYFQPVSDQGELNLMARRMFDAVAHRRQKMSLEIPEYQPALQPNVAVNVVDQSGAAMLSGYDASAAAIVSYAWIKKIAVIVASGDAGAGPYESQKIDIDTQWEQEVKN